MGQNIMQYRPIPMFIPSDQFLASDYARYFFEHASFAMFPKQSTAESYSKL